MELFELRGKAVGLAIVQPRPNDRFYLELDDSNKD